MSFTPEQYQKYYYNRGGQATRAKHFQSWYHDGKGKEIRRQYYKKYYEEHRDQIDAQRKKRYQAYSKANPFLE